MTEGKMSSYRETMPALQRRSAAQWINILFKALLLVVLVCVFVPFDPSMPGFGLDPSWVFGMNWAVSQGLRIGTDVIFTFGPYASIYTRSYHPATDTMMLTGSLFLAITCWMAIIYLTSQRTSIILALTLTVMLTAHSRDVLLLMIPLLAGLIVYRISHQAANTSVLAKHQYALLFIIFAAVGFIPLIKGSLLLLSISMTLGCALILWIKNQRTLSFFAFVVPAVSLMACWNASGQSVGDLGNFLINIAPIISGYTEAMAYPGEVSEIGLYIACAVLILASTFERHKKPALHITDFYLPAVYFLFLFISFKAAFVRHDAHALAGGLALLLASVTLQLVRHNLLAPVALALSLLTSGVMFNRYVGLTWSEAVKVYDWAILGAERGLTKRLTWQHWPKSEYDTLLAGYKRVSPFSVLPGRSDIYSYNQTLLIASGNTWAPRPVIQSYSVYTPGLMEINRHYLMGANAPDNIFFKVEPIDGRLPSMEDGASWPALLAHYRPIELIGDYLRLKKISAAEEPIKADAPAVQEYQMGEEVTLPALDRVVVARINITPTMSGRLANILFTPTELKMTVNLRNGEVRTFRIVSGMLKTGVVISPLVENAKEFAYLFAGTEFLAAKQVKSFSISQQERIDSSWQPRYTVAFSDVNLRSEGSTSWSYNLDNLDAAAEKLPVVTLASCNGAIDEVQGAAPVSSLTPGRLLSARGWLAASAEKGTLPENAYIVLTDEHGDRTFIKGLPELRPDVAAAFNQPDLVRAGYTISFDTQGRRGLYRMQLAMKNAGHIEVCPEYSITLNLVAQVKR
jgi:hypothetical protein